MKRIIVPLSLAVGFFTSCSSASTNIFSKKTPLEKYEDKLEDNGLHKTPEGRLWLAASEQSLQYPVAVQVPYSVAGNFSQKRPQALGLQFNAVHGERLQFAIDKTDSASFVLYAELYKKDVGGNMKLLQSPDTNIGTFSYDVAETGTYVLKVQPQLFRVGKYRLSVSTGPSLSFPVDDKKAYIGSIWGDNRDGGKRSHEGVDIFAAKRTPAVAAADGYITSVREGGIGGKTVWLRPKGQNITLYYAHLDEQLVTEGQEVKQGDVVGLVGNTGNAKYTPSHLHFGIYGFGGAINPFPFVNRQTKKAPAVAKKMDEYIRLTKDIVTSKGTIKKNTVLQPLAVTASDYIAQLPDGTLVQATFAQTQAATQPLKKTKSIIETALYTTPSAEAPVVSQVALGSAVSVLGYFDQYVFIKADNAHGWVHQSALKS